MLLKTIHILLIFNFCLFSTYAQIDSSKYKNGCLVCEVYKKDYKKGRIIKNILKSFEDTTIVTITFEVNDYKGSPAPYSEIIFNNIKGKGKNIYYTDQNGKTSIETNEGDYLVTIRSFFESDTILINPLSLKAGDIREISIDAGESKCLQARQIYFSQNIGRDYTISYYSNFKNCTFSHYIGDNLYLDPPTPSPDSTKFYWGNHQLGSIAFHRNCLQEGTWKAWDMNGKLYNIEKYENGKPEGIWISRNRNGDIVEYRKFKNGNQVGKYCSYVLFPGSIVESYYEKNGAFKTTYINLKAKEVTTTYVSKKGFTTKQTKRGLRVDLDSYEYKITETGDLILQKK